MVESSGQTEGGRIGRLDGTRALAIFLVFFHHASLLPIGWTGVSLFFVLSGLLITGILRRARNNHAFWGPFYIKRATRILPPLVIAYAGAAIFCSIPWRKVGLYNLFFLSNVSQAIYQGQSKTLDVLWSLSVEEHFYFLWPFAVRFLDRRHLIRLLIGLLLFEPLLRALATPLFHTCWPIYFLTPFQLDGLAAGSLLALLLEDPAAGKRIAQWSWPTTVASLVIFAGLSRLPSFQREANSVLFNSLGYSLVAVISAGVISYVLLRPRALASRILGSRVAVFFGTISYGFYLFHGLSLLLLGRLAVLLHSTDHVRRLIPLLLIPATVASWLSFNFYEKPIVRWGRRKARQIEITDKPAVPTAS